VFSLLLDDVLELATPLTRGAINETLRQFAPYNQTISSREKKTLANGIIDDVKRQKKMYA